MENQNMSDLDAKPTRSGRGARPRTSRKRSNPEGKIKSAAKSKKDQLIGFLSKPSGARASVLGERLGWQAHTVRAALSGLRKQGFEIAASKSTKTGETVYSITGHTESSTDPADGAAA